WKADEDALAKACYGATVKRLRRDLDGVAWQLELLLNKGIYVVDDTAHGWGGPGRLDPPLLSQAQSLLRHAVQTVGDLAKVSRALAEADSGIGHLRRQTDALAAAALAADGARALGMVSRHFAGPWPVAPEAKAGLLARVRAEMEKQFGHPLPHLNESRYDRLGWINHPELTDSHIGKWGIRINPVTGPTKVQGPRRWRFALDPNDTGLKELRHTIGYNIENQWPQVPMGRPWNQDQRFSGYKGVAWYRGRLHVPGEWAGESIVLTVPLAGKERVWLGNVEITDRGSGQGRRTYTIPADLIAFGGENVLALRIESRDEKRRGIVGTVEAACPALDSDAATKTPAVDVLSTPLSPCVALTPRTDTLEIHHAGKATLLLPPGNEAGGYDAAKVGKLKANWAFVRPPAGPSARPILLVFEKNPGSIACETGVTRIKTKAGARVIAVRPWVKLDPNTGKKPVDVRGKAAFWSRAALAVPLNYMEVTRVARPGEPWQTISIDNVPRGPVLHHTVIYDYLETVDEWGTKPLRIAPLPAFCSFAIDTNFRGLKIDEPERIETLQDGGLLAPYRGIQDADRVSYSYPIEPYPRFAGFTSWMFSPVDTGVPGNEREMEAIASTGANSYRPQHNWSDHLPPKGMWPPEEKRTRLQIMADFCNAVGANYMNNIDETLGQKPEAVTGDYAAFMEKVCVHYETIARQLGDRPFWAVAYDLINEAFHHKHQEYNPALRRLIGRVRKIDRRHLCYVEPCESWGAIQELALIEPTGDPLTVHSFHDYNFRLHKAEDRWPTLEKDITDIYRMWLPAFVYAIRNGVCMHCGEFGGFAPETNDSQAQTILMNDFFRVFDQFGMHHHYYTGRGIFDSQIGGRRADGALQPSNVVRAYRKYFARKDFNLYYTKWPGHPVPVK
ncbi:MAG TPA: cellulase family glycosylhydrolase, partial [Phycisphaerae bacterium]|nr:cellulase family glycosylhydrolase [Phycisphaerae bacterium]